MTGGYLPGGRGEYVNGSVVQTAGNNVVSAGGYYNGLYLENGGMYTLSGNGQISTPIEWVGYSGSGTFTQTGGTNAVVEILCCRIRRLWNLQP